MQRHIKITVGGSSSDEVCPYYAVDSERVGHSSWICHGEELQVEVRLGGRPGMEEYPLFPEDPPIRYIRIWLVQ